jgi:hypothetical protein
MEILHNSVRPWLIFVFFTRELISGTGVQMQEVWELGNAGAHTAINTGG